MVEYNNRMGKLIHGHLPRREVRVFVVDRVSVFLHVEWTELHCRQRGKKETIEQKKERKRAFWFLFLFFCLLL